MLDDPAARASVDGSEFWRLIAGLPEQARAAWELGRAWDPPEGFRRPERVVILGMGGSAIGGDVAATLACRLGSTPVEVVRDYTAPPAGEATLVVACSFSGNTEEVLTAFSAQIDGPGMRLALTTGGRLAALAIERGAPLLGYDFNGPPRTAFGYGLLPLLAVLRRLDVLALDDGAVDEALARLDRDAEALGLDRPAASNRAKQLATRLHGSLPVIVGADPLAVAARRWAGQIAENAKQWAFAAALPEADHNAIVALERGQDASRGIGVVLLGGVVLHERNRARVEVTAAELAAARVDHEVIEVSAADPLGAMMEACYLGDWVSYYLALLNRTDPRETRILDRVKAAMAEHERT